MSNEAILLELFKLLKAENPSIHVVTLNDSVVLGNHAQTDCVAHGFNQFVKIYNKHTINTKEYYGVDANDLGAESIALAFFYERVMPSINANNVELFAGRISSDNDNEFQLIYGVIYGRDVECEKTPNPQ